MHLLTACHYGLCPLDLGLQSRASLAGPLRSHTKLYGSFCCTTQFCTLLAQLGRDNDTLVLACIDIVPYRSRAVRLLYVLRYIEFAVFAEHTKHACPHAVPLNSCLWFQVRLSLWTPTSVVVLN